MTEGRRTTSKITRYDDELLRRLNEIESEVRRARTEARSAGDTATRAARTLRSSSKSRYEAEARAGWERLAPPVSLVTWKPRQGDAEAPELGTSLIDRLKAGDPVSDSIGNIASFVGASNALVDPTLETFGTLDVSTTLVSAGDWRAICTINSGTPTGDGQFDDLYDRGAIDNPFNSEILGMYAPRALAALDAEILLYGWTTLPSYQTNMPYVVASVLVFDYAQQQPSVTAAECTLEIYDTSTSTVVASTTIDFIKEPTAAPRQITCAVRTNPPTSYYRWRLKLRGVKGVNTGLAECACVFFGEPQLHLSYTPDPIPFTPQIAWWKPPRVVGYGTAGQYPMLSMDKGGLSFGTGITNEDVTLDRGGTGMMRVRATSAVDETVFQISAFTGKEAALQIFAAAAPTTPATGYGALYFSSSDERFHVKLDDGSDFAIYDSGGVDSPLVLAPTDGTNEGGEIQLVGAGTYDDMILDNYQGKFRIIGGGVEWLRVYGHAQFRADSPYQFHKLDGSAQFLRTGGILVSDSYSHPDPDIMGIQFGADVALWRGAANVLELGSGDVIRSYGETWIEPTLNNSWVNYSSTYPNAAYRLDAGSYVHLQGLVKDGTVNGSANIFQLPAGYRPAHVLIFIVMSNDTVGEVRVDTSGNVVAYAPSSNTWVSLDSISFLAEG